MLMCRLLLQEALFAFDPSSQRLAVCMATTQTRVAVHSVQTLARLYHLELSGPVHVDRLAWGLQGEHVCTIICALGSCQPRGGLSWGETCYGWVSVAVAFVKASQHRQQRVVQSTVSGGCCHVSRSAMQGWVWRPSRAFSC